MTPKQKAHLLLEHFFISGYGHFDLTVEDVSIIIDILERSQDVKEDLSNLYDKLYQQRMG
jgi:hypothetical protein